MKKSPLGQKISAFFADTSPFMAFIGRIALLVVVNLCWLVCCLPVVTAGASSTAMYTVLLAFDGHTFDTAFKAFFTAFRRRFRSATLLWLPFMALGALLLLDWRLLNAQGLTDSMGVMVLLLLAGAVYAFSLLWLFPVLATVDSGFLATVKTAFLLGLRELWRSFLLLALSCLPLAMLTLYAQAFMTLWEFWLLIGFGALAFLKSRVMVPILKTLRAE